MTNKNFTPHIVKFYSKVGAPEMTFFISLISLFFIPFIFDIRNQLLETVLLTIFIFALFYLIYDSNNKIGRNYAVLLTIILILEWLRYFDFATIGYLNTISQIVIMLVSFYFVFKSIFYSKKIDVNTLNPGIYFVKITD